MDLHAWITQQVDRAEEYALDHQVNPTAVLRRCEADRRILARHRVDPASAESPTFATACDGCRCEWLQDECEPFVDNLNDCPELLDLAHEHGITPDILASLDRPTLPEPKGRAQTAPTQSGGHQLAQLLTRPITTADVPAALRGPNWKP